MESVCNSGDLDSIPWVGKIPWRKKWCALGTYQPGEFIFQCAILLPFHTVHGVLKARILKWFAIPFSSGPPLSELSTMTRPSCVALHSLAHSFIELEKAVSMRSSHQSMST